MITYREATKEEIPYIAKLSSLSFGNYPFFDFAFLDCFKEASAYFKYMDKLHLVHLSTNMTKHKCFVGIQNNKIISVALLQDSTCKQISVLDYIQAGGITLIYPVSFIKILDFFELSEKAHQDCSEKYPTSWYLEMLAVNPTMKECGLGSAMLKDCVIPFIQKRGGKELTLITNTEQNCKFYTKNGFYKFAERALDYKNQKINNWSFVINVRD